MLAVRQEAQGEEANTASVPSRAVDVSGVTRSDPMLRYSYLLACLPSVYHPCQLLKVEDGPLDLGGSPGTSFLRPLDEEGGGGGGEGDGKGLTSSLKRQAPPAAVR